MGKDLKNRELGKGFSQRKDGRYQARFTDRFGNRREFKDSNLKVVQEWYDKETSLDKLKINVIHPDIKLDEWYDKWLSVHKYGVLREDTMISYTTHYRKHVQPVIGQKRLQDITTLDVKDLINNMKRSGYSFEMQNRTKILLQDLFGKAMIDNFVYKNPAKPVKLERDEEVEPRVLSVEEQQIFFDCCRGTFYDNLFITIVETGIRPGEAYALKPSDIDLQNNVIRIDKTLKYVKRDGDTKKTFHMGPPKTKQSYREIPINKRVRNALMKQIMQKRIMESKNGYQHLATEFRDCIFVTSKNTLLNAQIVGEAIDRLLKEINFIRDPLQEFEHFSPHTFRHTFATRAIEAGMKPKVLQKILGHATLAMTMDLYCHVSGDEKVSQMEIYDDYMQTLNDIELALTQKKYADFNSNNVINLCPDGGVRLVSNY